MSFALILNLILAFDNDITYINIYDYQAIGTTHYITPIIYAPFKTGQKSK